MNKIIAHYLDLFKKDGLFGVNAYFRYSRYARKHFSTVRNIMFAPPEKVNITGKKIAVYSCIIGRYDEIIEPKIIEPDVDYYMFSDQDLPENTVWKKIDMTDFEEYQQMTPTQLNRLIKMLPYTFLKGYDYSMYLDGNIQIVQPICPLIEQMGHCAFGVHYHSRRDCVYDEAVSVKYYHKSDPKLTDVQMEHYRSSGFPEHYGLYENSILIREHSNQAVRELMTRWWREYNDYPTRDQFCLPFIIWKTGFSKEDIFIIGASIPDNPRFRRITKHLQ